jgi:molecular chaperone GrpE
VASTSKVKPDADRAEPGAPAQQAEEAGPEDPVKKLEARIDALEDGILRAKADYQNLQRRSAAERLDAVRYANAELMRSLVAVADDFERALESCRKHESAEAIAKGVQIVYDHFTKALHDQGLEPIEALHRPFDPAVHEAMMQQPTQEQPPGTVVEEVAKGYRLHDRVIRPAKVVVATAPKVAQSGE